MVLARPLKQYGIAGPRMVSNPLGSLLIRDEWHDALRGKPCARCPERQLSGKFPADQQHVDPCGGRVRADTRVQLRRLLAKLGHACEQRDTSRSRLLRESIERGEHTGGVRIIRIINQHHAAAQRDSLVASAWKFELRENGA